MANPTASRPPSKLYDLDITIVSAKHLKNVNWKNGDLKPYVILWVDRDRRQATKPDEFGSTRPVWNERFVLPLTLPPWDSSLTLEIFHSKPSETLKPLVGTLRFEIRDLLSDSDGSVGRIKTLELKRPSGRPQGKIRLKIALSERPVETYQTGPPPSYYYSSAPAPAPPPLHPHNYRGYSPFPPPPPPASSPPPRPYSYGGYSDPHPAYYSSYYQPSPPPSRPFFERQPSYGPPPPGPSAPVDYTPYDYHKRTSGNLGAGAGAGLAVGAVAGVLGGLALEEGVKYEEDKVADRVENEVVSTSRDDHYKDYRSEY